MKKIKIESMPSHYDTKVPSKSFEKELALQATPEIQCMIENRAIRDNFYKTICLRVEPENYLNTIFKNQKNYMKAYIYAYSTAFELCEIIVCWQDDSGTLIYPWEELNGEVMFELCISDDERKKLNKVIPMIYHPVVKAKDSGLFFDYQIFFGGQYLNLYFKESINSNDLSEVEKILNEFFTEWNCSHDIKLHNIEIVNHTNSVIKVGIDLGGCGKDAVEKLIRNLNLPKIKKIVFK